MKSKFITLLFCIFFGLATVYSQQKIFVTTQNPFAKIISTDTIKVNNITPSASMLVSPSFYSNNLAFFCRQEIRFEKLTKIPFKFRLGSVQQVDYLEGKKNSVPIY